MFAEIYTHYYTGGKLPPAVNGKDPKAFFQKLEASRDSQVVPSDVPPQKSHGFGGGPQAPQTQQKFTPPAPTLPPQFQGGE